jgi:EpsI family protein
MSSLSKKNAIAVAPSGSVSTTLEARGSRLLFLGLIMVLASLLAWGMKPTKYWSQHIAAVKYATLFPIEFGAWKLASEQSTAVVNPQQQETLDAIYDEIVSRVYVDGGSGRRIMISLAYGNNQSRATQVHKPEVCYPAQGFELVSMRKDLLDLAKPQQLPVMRMVAQMGRRVEPITYWIRTGDRVVRGAVEQNIARVSLGLRGYIPDGLLFRVSEINPDTNSSFSLQDRFVREFLAQQAPNARESLIGVPRGP